MRLFSVSINLDQNPTDLDDAGYVASLLAALASKIGEHGVHDCQIATSEKDLPMLIAYSHEVNKDLH